MTRFSLFFFLAAHSIFSSTECYPTGIVDVYMIKLSARWIKNTSESDPHSYEVHCNLSSYK